jgi:methanogenic corrinoid protein MtbC1
MALTRRGLGHLAFSGAVALGASGLNRQSLAESTDQVAVNQVVEALRKAILDADQAQLRDLIADELSYGLWPTGQIQNKSEFINSIVLKGTLYKSITYSDPSTVIASNDAIVRHRETVEADNIHGHYSVEFGVLQIWQKRDGQWRLLARQGWKT